MHYHLEIVMPPTESVEAAVTQIMAPFREHHEDGEEPNSHPFWDFWVIGGRWAGEKIRQSYDDEKLTAFHQALHDAGVTVSGLQFGKQELSPSNQIPLVDALWNQHFPDARVKVCPLFQHYNNQYENTALYPDVMLLKDIPPQLKASHVIIAGPGWREDGEFEAKEMMQESFWNGVSHVHAKWDGSVISVIDKHRAHLKHAEPDYKMKQIPQDDWLVVTVDYHS